MITLTNNITRPYMLDIRSHFDREIPADFGTAFVKTCTERNKVIQEDWTLGELPKHFTEGTYQERATKVATRALTGHIFNFSPGLGKTRSAIDTLRHSCAQTALVITPAMVRKTWEKEIETWWPDAAGDFCIMAEGARKSNSKGARETLKVIQDKAAAGQRLFVATSYGLLSKLPEELPHSISAIIFDEIHSLQSPTTKQFKAAQELITRYPAARRYGLTGTLFTNGIINAHGPLSTIFPGRYGTRHAFGTRYTQANHNGFGWEYPGVEPAYLEELKWRLSLVTSRVTEEDAMKEAGSTLPTISLQEIDEEDEQFDIEDWVGNTLLGGDTRIAILSYRRDAVHMLTKKLAKLGNVVEISGELSPEERATKLDEAIASPRPAIVVATISSIKIGINAFANFPVVLFADLSDNLEEMTQALLRFRRRGSTLSRVRGYMLTNVITAPKALRLRRKIDAISAVLKIGAAEGTLQTAFAQQNEFTDAEMQDALASILGSKTDDDGGAE